MNEWLKDVGLPLFTFLAGVTIEHCRQLKNTKKEKLKGVDEKLRTIISIVSANERNIALLKYEYNAVHRDVEDFCVNYGGEFEFFRDDLISLNLYSAFDGNADKVSKCAISIINKIKQL